MTRPLPNFLIVGAAKSGTTSLYSYLNTHPDIYFPEVKEPSFLVASKVRNRIPTWVESFDDYQALFSNSENFIARGEASVLYLYFFQTAIPKAIELLGPETKIIICLRNPVDRAYSAYFDSHRFDPKESLSFEQALAQEELRMNDDRYSPMMHYKAMGLYSAMVAAYMEHFSNVKIVLFDDLSTDTAGVVKQLCEFLAVDPALANTSGGPVNTGGTYWSNPGLGRLVKWAVPAGVRRFLVGVAPTVHKKLKGFAVNRLMGKAPSMQPQVRSKLYEYFGSDVHDLQTVIGRDLTHWLKSPPSG